MFSDTPQKLKSGMMTSLSIGTASWWATIIFVFRTNWFLCFMWMHEWYWILIWSSSWTSWDYNFYAYHLNDVKKCTSWRWIWHRGMIIAKSTADDNNSMIDLQVVAIRKHKAIRWFDRVIWWSNLKLIDWSARRPCWRDLAIRCSDRWVSLIFKDLSFYV